MMEKYSNITIIIRESNLKERVRLSKMISYLVEEKKAFELWKKKGSDQVDFPIKEISKNYLDKKKEYVFWMVKLFLNLLKSKNTGKILVSGFESALVVYVSSFFVKIEYLFDNPDNFYQSKQLPVVFKNILLYIERKIIKKSIVTLVPDKSRIGGYSIPEDKFKVLRNFPSKKDLKESLLVVNEVKNRLVIYINGWLVPTRGLDMITNFIEKIPKGLDLKIIIAGKKDGLEKILRSDYVEYKGVVNAIESLSYYGVSDLILTFYDPRLEINRKASPNKWGDAIITKTVPILNNGIETTNTYFPNGGYFSIEYGKHEELFELIMGIYDNKLILQEKIKGLEKNPAYFWEDQMKEILNF